MSLMWNRSVGSRPAASPVLSVKTTSERAKEHQTVDRTERNKLQRGPEARKYAKTYFSVPSMPTHFLDPLPENAFAESLETQVVSRGGDRLSGTVEKLETTVKMESSEGVTRLDEHHMLSTESMHQFRELGASQQEFHNSDMNSHQAVSSTHTNLSIVHSDVDEVSKRVGALEEEFHAKKVEYSLLAGDCGAQNVLCMQGLEELRLSMGRDFARLDQGANELHGRMIRLEERLEDICSSGQDINTLIHNNLKLSLESKCQVWQKQIEIVGKTHERDLEEFRTTFTHGLTESLRRESEERSVEMNKLQSQLELMKHDMERRGQQMDVLKARGPQMDELQRRLEKSSIECNTRLDELHTLITQFIVSRSRIGSIAEHESLCNDDVMLSENICNPDKESILYDGYESFDMVQEFAMDRGEEFSQRYNDLKDSYSSLMNELSIAPHPSVRADTFNLGFTELSCRFAGGTDVGRRINTLPALGEVF